jgi:FkbM family methyltransferase
MSGQSVVLYRLYFAPKAVLQRVMARWPWTRRPIERAKRWLKRFLLSEGRRLVRVRVGLSAGLLMHLQFPAEAGVWRGEHEPLVQKAIEAVVQSGWVVFDVGSYIGSLALGAARLVGETGCVVAFDGDPVNAVRLREHATINHFERTMQVVPAAVWSHSAPDGLTFRCGSRMRSQGGVEAEAYRPLLGDGELIRVPAVSLDDFVLSSGLRPRLIKVDVEGGEAQVLRGAAALLANDRPLLIVEIHTPQALEEVRRCLVQHDYRVHEVVLYDPVPVSLFAWPGECEPEGWWFLTVKPDLS